MRWILIYGAYLAYAVFCLRLFSQVMIWLRAPRPAAAGPHARAGLYAFSVAALDLIFFRRLFSRSKPLWIGSWTFHVSFLLVAVRHLQYFLDPVPDCVWRMMPLGVAAGYLLPSSLILLLLIRLLLKRQRYPSPYNYFLLGCALIISSAGVVMRNYFPPDLVDVKAFVIGILTFSPGPLPGSAAFVVHVLPLLILLPFLPLHMIAAPLVTLDARRREEERAAVMHD